MAVNQVLLAWTSDEERERTDQPDRQDDQADRRRPYVVGSSESYRERW